eukprot:m.396282 g.396282  ORF g.396282 m.396282 type:complete len:165 (+) comp20102_c2_seq4:206-700(+)
MASPDWNSPEPMGCAAMSPGCCGPAWSWWQVDGAVVLEVETEGTCRVLAWLCAVPTLLTSLCCAYKLLLRTRYVFRASDRTLTRHYIKTTSVVTQDLGLFRRARVVTVFEGDGDETCDKLAAIAEVNHSSVTLCECLQLPAHGDRGPEDLHALVAAINGLLVKK